MMICVHKWIEKENKDSDEYWWECKNCGQKSAVLNIRETKHNLPIFNFAIRKKEDG